MTRDIKTYTATISLSKEELDKGRLANQLRKLSNKTGYRFKDPFVESIKKQQKDLLLSLKNNLRKEMKS